jgi:hypothetical protein
MLYDLVYRNLVHIFQSLRFIFQTLFIVLVFDLIICLDLYHNYEYVLFPYVP